MKMPRTFKYGTPKNLEKILYINHKEDQILVDRLDELNKVSRNKIMEMDRESNMVKKELRNSRKKNLTLNEAMAAGLLPTPEMLYPPDSNKNRKLGQFSARSQIPPQTRLTSSAPAHRNSTQEGRPAFSRSNSCVQRTGSRKLMPSNQFSRQPTIIEVNENGNGENGVSNISVPHMSIDRRTSFDSIGSYVLDEFEKISQVVPDILRALAKKKEQQKEKEEAAAALRSVVLVEKDRGNITDYEPDMNKVRRTVTSVKKLRHRMAISKKLETNKPNKSLAQMIKDRTDSFGEYDEYTDGTCSLMKRRLEKKRRESLPPVPEIQSPRHRHSSLHDLTDTRRGSTFGGLDRRRSTSMFSLAGSMSRSNTMFEFGSPFKSDIFSGGESADGTQIIDEDTLLNQQKIFREIQNYRVIQNKIDSFLFPGQYGPVAMAAVIEEVVPI